ncbi:MAG: hypothetical protein HC763_02010 [Hydrococcus sp. CRU_1_1]|nr:hypothetical protein [Hydrococcus sp. CRU_1_1]
MKTVDQLLSEFYSLGIKLWVEGDRLRYKAQKDVLTSDRLASLKEHKAEIIAFLQETTPAVKTDVLPKLLPVARKQYLPLSFSQQRLWLEEQFDPGKSSYNIPLAYLLTGKLDLVVLKQCLLEIIRRHEILRVTFHCVDGDPVQIISPDIALDLPVVDLQDFPRERREEAARQEATKEAQTPFDLVAGPVYHFKLLRLSESESVLLLTIHHIVADGWSSEVFFRELTRLYEAFAKNQPSPLSELPIQYVDFACWQRQWLQGEALESQLDYWKQQLGGSLPILQLPTDRPRSLTPLNRGDVQRQMLSEELTDSLRKLSQRAGATLSMTLLAAFNVLLYRYSGQDDLIVGSPIAGRNQVEVEELIGFLSIPWRCGLIFQEIQVFWSWCIGCAKCL